MRLAESFSNDTDGVSPVVAAVLMLATTVAIAAVAGSFVWTTLGDAQNETPNAEFAFTYSEDVDRSEEDSYDNTGAAVNAAGKITFVLEDGESIAASQLRILGTANEGTVADEVDGYGPTDDVKVGDTITVWVNRGDSVDIVWESEDGGESAILDSFTVRPTTTLPPHYPEPDYGCDWVEDQLASTSSLVVDGIVVHCDLDQYSSIDTIDIVNDGAVIGNVNASSDITLNDGATYDGFVNSESGKLDTTGASEINGDVHAPNGVDLDEGTEVNGDVNASGSDVNLWQNSRITGSVSIGGSSTMYVDHSQVHGSIDADNNVDLIDAVVQGSIEATGSVGLDQSTMVQGDVLVDSAGDLTCNDGDSSTIDGEGCLAYQAPEFLVTIEDSTQPVEGNVMDVTVTVENVGLESGSKDVDLEIAGSVVDTNNVNVGGESQTQTTLQWGTSNGDAGTHDAVAISPDDSDTGSVLVADDSRSQTDLEFEVAGEAGTVTIKDGKTVGYTATAIYDDGSEEDVTSSVTLTNTDGDGSNISIDETNNEIAATDTGTVTVKADDGSMTETVGITVTTSMADATTLTTGSQSSKGIVNFDLENTGTKEVGITAIAVNSTTDSKAVRVDYDGENETEGGDGYLNTQKIDICNCDPLSFTKDATIASGVTENFVLGEFRDDKGKDRQMSGETITFTLYFTDGSKKTFSFTA